MLCASEVRVALTSTSINQNFEGGDFHNSLEKVGSTNVQKDSGLFQNNSSRSGAIVLLRFADSVTLHVNALRNIADAAHAAVREHSNTSARRGKETFSRVRGALRSFRLGLVMLLSSGCASMIDNTRVHRPLPWTGATLSFQRELAPDSPASERVTDIKGTSYCPAQIGPKANTHLGIIEFTDQGMLKEPKQLLDTSDFIKGRPMNRPLVLVIFVHGWNHNASPRDGNLRQFREILMNLRKQDVPSADILGVYLGWPGNVRMPLPQLSYFSRLSAAERVGRVTCTEVMLSLIAHAKTTESGDKSAARRNVKTIVIGHSMGGLIVERAFLQAMIGYGITNAPTSDQVDSLKAAQAAEVEKHRTAAKQSEERLGIRAGELVAASDKEKIAQEEFSIYGSKSESLRNASDVSREACAEMASAFARLMADAKQVQEDLNDLASHKSWSEQQREAILELAKELCHDKQGVPDSVHHALNGLRAWSLAPEKSIEDETSTSQFRKSPEDYANEVRVKRADGMVWPPRVQLAWDNFATLLGTNSAIADFRKKMVDLFGDSKRQFQTDNSGAPPIFVAVQTYEDKRMAYNAAQAAYGAYKQTGNFAKFQSELTQAVHDRDAVKQGVDEARREIRVSSEKEQQAVRLVEKLDIVRERPPADLILLINPASDASLAQQMQQAWEPKRGGDLLSKMWRNKRHPWIISISSEFDAATRIAYPIGMGISRMFRGAARPAEGRWMTHTAPHVTEMQTHEVTQDETGRLRLLDLRPKKGMPLTPLWVIKADKKTDPQHNVSTENFVKLVPFLLRETNVLGRSEPAGD